MKTVGGDENTPVNGLTHHSPVINLKPGSHRKLSCKLGIEAHYLASDWSYTNRSKFVRSNRNEARYIYKAPIITSIY